MRIERCGNATVPFEDKQVVIIQSLLLKTSRMCDAYAAGRGRGDNRFLNDLCSLQRTIADMAIDLLDDVHEGVIFPDPAFDSLQEWVTQVQRRANAVFVAEEERRAVVERSLSSITNEINRLMQDGFDS